MKKYIVYLFKSPDCRRGWLAYLVSPGVDRSRATFRVSIEAKNGQEAKTKAITAANRGFEGVEILAKNFDDQLWGINNFDDLKEVFCG